MAVDYARYLQCVEIPDEDPHLLHNSSCPLFGSSVFSLTSCVDGWSAPPSSPNMTHVRRANSVGNLDSPTLRPASPVPTKAGRDNCKKNISNYDIHRRLEGHHNASALHSCLRQCNKDEKGEAKGGSVQNHWAASHGMLGSTLALQLGKALTLHTSPRIKRKGKQKHVKFADDYGETLVTFNIVPKIEFPNNRYWSFIEQTECDREYFQDFNGEDVEDEDDDFHSEVCSPDDMAFPWHVQFEFPSNTSEEARRDSQDSLTSLCSTESSSSACSFSFDQPAADFGAFQKKLEENFVCLENVKLDETATVVTCSIKVKNLHPSKRVIARCTSDNWATYADLHATYADPGYKSSVYDTFSFAITKPQSNTNKARMEFAILYEVCGQTYWDNNNGENYIIEWSTTPPVL